MKKNMNTFIEEVVKELGTRLDSGYMVSTQTLLKNNGVVRQYIVITDRIHAVSPCYYMEDYYELYQQPGDIQLVADDILKAYRQEYFPDFSPVCLSDRERMLHNVMFRIVSTFKNRELLENVPHYDILGLDVSMVYYILANTGMDKYASILLRKQNMEMLGTSEKELLENALINTPLEMKHVICSMEELVCGNSGKAEGCAACPADMKVMHIITNRQKLYGAGCIFYPGVLAETAQKLGSDFYILPSSIHETIAIPAACFDRNSAMELKTVVMSVNRTELACEDVLTDSVYFYDSSQNSMFIAA